MTEMHSARVLLSLRRSRIGGVCLFLLLLGLMIGERRLADAHYNLRSSAVGIESADSLDGDEIRVRLIVLNDDKPPSLSDSEALHVATVVLTEVPHLDRVPLGRPAPRGPPPPPAAPGA